MFSFVVEIHAHRAARKMWERAEDFLHNYPRVSISYFDFHLRL